MPITFENNLPTEPFIQKIARSGMPILVTGHTGSGKTALLQQILQCTPADPQQLTFAIEDTREIQDPHRTIVRVPVPRPGQTKNPGDLTPEQAQQLVACNHPEIVIVGEIDYANAAMAHQILRDGNSRLYATICGEITHAAHQNFAERIQHTGGQGTMADLVAEIEASILTIQVSCTASGKHQIDGIHYPAGQAQAA